MTLCNKHAKHLCWACILESKPELQPPGFYETVDKLYPKEVIVNDKPDKGHA